MANRRTETNRTGTGRSRLASQTLLLLPGFMFLGFLAPAAVTVDYKGAPQEEVAVSFRNFQLPTRRPLVRSESSAEAETSELAAIRDALVSGIRMVAGRARDVFKMSDFALQRDDEILLDEGAEPEADVVDRLFDSTEDDAILAVDLTPLWNRSRFDIIPGPLRTWGGHLDDDFPGQDVVFREPAPRPVAIPEPASATLLSLGLLGIALRRTRA